MLTPPKNASDEYPKMYPVISDPTNTHKIRTATGTSKSSRSPLDFLRLVESCCSMCYQKTSELAADPPTQSSRSPMKKLRMIQRFMVQLSVWPILPEMPAPLLSTGTKTSCV